MTQTLSLDIVSDVVCPWCYVGKKRMDKALALFGPDRVRAVWRPFQLDPTIPEGGVDRKTYLKNKFGDGERPKQMLHALEAAGEAESIPFNFTNIERTPNTLKAHRLIHWSLNAGCQDAVVTKLFEAYFVAGKDIGDEAVLAALAGGAGMDTALVAKLLNSDADLDVITGEIDAARQMGISGVPTFIVNSQYAVSGAQEPDTLVQLLNKAEA
jgi:predicted DsbA family dithiol-disulfide isomerase